MQNIGQVISRSSTSVLSTNKVIRNTYMLLSLTLLFSAVMAAVSMSVGISQTASLFCTLGAIGLLWFVLPRFENSAGGLVVVFAFAGLMGLGLGPLISYYLAAPGGAKIVTTALGGTGAIFLGLSGYALTTRKDFSFMGGFLFVGILVAFLAGLGALIFSLPTLSLAVSAMFILLMSGYILFQTSAMIHGGETNYIMATISLYIAIYNLFLSLLNILAAFSGRR